MQPLQSCSGSLVSPSQFCLSACRLNKLCKQNFSIPPEGSPLSCLANETAKEVNTTASIASVQASTAAKWTLLARQNTAVGMQSGTIQHVSDAPVADLTHAPVVTLRRPGELGPVFHAAFDKFYRPVVTAPVLPPVEPVIEPESSSEHKTESKTTSTKPGATTSSKKGATTEVKANKAPSKAPPAAGKAQSAAGTANKKGTPAQPSQANVDDPDSAVDADGVAAAVIQPAPLSPRSAALKLQVEHECKVYADLESSVLKERDTGAQLLAEAGDAGLVRQLVKVTAEMTLAQQEQKERSKPIVQRRAGSAAAPASPSAAAGAGASVPQFMQQKVSHKFRCACTHTFIDCLVLHARRPLQLSPVSQASNLLVPSKHAVRWTPP